MENRIESVKINFFHVSIGSTFYLEKECYWEFKKTSETTAQNHKHGNITFNPQDQVYIPVT